MVNLKEDVRERVIIRPPVKYNYDKINEFRRLYQKHKSLQRQIEGISWANMMSILIPSRPSSKAEFEEAKEIFKEVRLQSIAISDRLAFLLAWFYDENVLVNVEYKVLED